MDRNLDKFFLAESVAVVGASTDQKKVGYGVLKNLVSSNFNGKVYPVNPKTKELLGLKCYSSIIEIEDKIDLVVIVVPSKFVINVLEDCVKKDVHNVIIISAGFRESGIEGKKLEDQIITFIKENKINVVGPNCLGIINVISELNASFSIDIPPKGNISMVSQSGAILSGLIDWAKEEKIGFSKLVSLGNKIDLTEIDFLEYFKDDDTTDVILMYLEEIKDGRNFIKVARDVTKKKPVLVLKSGTTQSGAKATASHTGALAGSQKSYEIAFRQSGVIQCETLQDLIDYAQIFSMQPLINGKRIGIVTNAGGPGILAADASEKSGLIMSSLEPETTEILRTKLSPAANFHNPVDVLGDATNDIYQFALDIVLKDKNIDAMLCILTPQSMTDPILFAESISESAKKTKKPIVCSFIGGTEMKSGIELLKKNNIPNYLPERAVKSLECMVKYNQFKNISYDKPVKLSFDRDKIKNILEKVIKENRVNLDEFESREVISALNISIPEYGLAKSAQEARKISSKIGFPVVMKIVSPDILHKTDVGGVKLGLYSEQEVEDNFELMMIRCKRYMPNANIVGVTITKQVPQGKELIIGMSRDSNFGPVIMFGIGGIYVEILKDVSFRIAPLTEKDAQEMITELKMFPLLSGVRGEKSVDLNSIKNTLLKISQLCVEFEQILELDINPLIAYEESCGVKVVDVKITIKH